MLIYSLKNWTCSRHLPLIFFLQAAVKQLANVGGNAELRFLKITTRILSRPVTSVESRILMSLVTSLDEIEKSQSL